MHTTMETQQIKASLIQSIEHYERILEHMQILNREIGTAPSLALLKLNETLVDLQKDTSPLEESLAIQLSKHPDKSKEIHHLFAKREELLKDILFLNQQITEKALGIKSFIAHEIGKLHSGQTAMKGYRQQHYHQGRIVNSNS